MQATYRRVFSAESSSPVIYYTLRKTPSQIRSVALSIGAYCHKFRAQRPTFTTNPSPPGGGGVLLKVLAIRVFWPDFVAIRPRRRRKIYEF